MQIIRDSGREGVSGSSGNGFAQAVGLASNPVVFCDPDGRIRGLAALVAAGVVSLDATPNFICTDMQKAAPRGEAPP